MVPGTMAIAVFAACIAGATSNSGNMCKTQTGMDCIEADISNELKDTAEECCELCSATPKCNAFTYDAYNARGQRQGTCYMKSA